MRIVRVNVEKGLVISGVTTADTFNVTGNLSIGGTITYEDVTNVDSIGIITARKVLFPYADIDDFISVGNWNIHLGNAGVALLLQSTQLLLLEVVHN